MVLRKKGGGVPYIFSNEDVESFIKDKNPNKANEILNGINNYPAIRAGLIYHHYEDNPRAAFIFKEDLEKLLKNETWEDMNNKSLIQIFYHEKPEIGEKEAKRHLLKCIEDYLVGLPENGTVVKGESDFRKDLKKYGEAAETLFNKRPAYRQLSEDSQKIIRGGKEYSEFNENLANAYLNEISKEQSI